MSTTTTALTGTATMGELKPDAPSDSIWYGHGVSVNSTPRFPGTLDPETPQSSAESSQHSLGRTRSSLPALDHDHYPRYPPEGSDAYGRQTHPLPQHQAYPSLKRSYDQSNESTTPYQEMVHDLRDDDSKLNMSQDQKMLSFRKVQDKYTLVDPQGRMQTLDLSAQLHGMFFLSEDPAQSGGAVMQPELTCYRRNLFQISGELIVPRGSISVVLPETGESVPVSSTEVTVSANESVDGHPVRLIVIPWKTPPPNSPEIPQSADQEPPTLPLIPFVDDGEVEGEYAKYPLGWRRLQFRIATANNGRRKELQQHFVLHLKVYGTLANGSKVVMAEATTAPIVVRGRSPRNFQARKEIPLLGSSAGSRGQALVETGHGIIAHSMPGKGRDSRLPGLNLSPPRTAFTFNASKLTGSPTPMRNSSYSNWTPTTVPMSSLPLSSVSTYSSPGDMSIPSSMSSGHLPMVSHDRYSYGHSASGPHGLPLTTPSMSNGSDHSLSAPRYLEHPRPIKSARGMSQSSVHSPPSVTTTDSSEYRYGSSYGTLHHSSSSGDMSSSYSGSDVGSSSQSQGGPPPPPPREYYPSPNSWTSAAAEPSSIYAESRPYTFPDTYRSGHSIPPVKTDHGPVGSSYAHSHSLQQYAWGQS